MRLTSQTFETSAFFPSLFRFLLLYFFIFNNLTLFLGQLLAPQWKQFSQERSQVKWACLVPWAGWEQPARADAPCPAGLVPALHGARALGCPHHTCPCPQCPPLSQGWKSYRATWETPHPARDQTGPFPIQVSLFIPSDTVHHTAPTRSLLKEEWAVRENTWDREWTDMVKRAKKILYCCCTVVLLANTLSPAVAVGNAASAEGTSPFPYLDFSSSLWDSLLSQPPMPASSKNSLPLCIEAVSFFPV